MTPKAPSLKALAESKAEGIQKATYFKVRPDLVELEPGFNLREEGPELDEHIERLYHAMKAGAYIPPIDVAVVAGRPSPAVRGHRVPSGSPPVAR